MDSTIFIKKDIFLKRKDNMVILYNIHDYTNRLKMDKGTYHFLKLVNGERNISDIESIFQKEKNTDTTNTKSNLDSKKILQYLLDNNFLTLNSHDGKSIELEQKDPSIDIVNFRITNACNFNCVHCFPDSKVSKKKELRIDEIFNIVTELGKYKPLHITFTGGEPFLIPEFLDLVEFSNSKGMAVSICTNASLIKDKDIERLSKCALGAVKVSMDGATPETHNSYRGNGTFEKVIPKIKLLVEASIPVCINSVISKINFHEYKQILDLVQTLNVNEFAYDIIRYNGRAIQNWNDLQLSYQDRLECISYYRSFHPKAGNVIMGTGVFPPIMEDIMNSNNITKACATCLSNILILANGDLSPCWRLYDQGIFAGNLHEKSLDEIWNNGEIFQKVRNTEIDSVEKCKDCKEKILCDASCRGFALLEHNDWYGAPNEEKCRFSQDLINYKEI